jgi:hypothetical protein
MSDRDMNDDYGYDIHGNVVPGLRSKTASTHTITEDDRKRLTKFLGDNDGWYCKDEGCTLQRFDETDCFECTSRASICHDFTTPDDRQALCEALMREGKWEDFGWYTVKHWQLSEREEGISNTGFGHMFWLLVENPERFCYLVAKFL